MDSYLCIYEKDNDSLYEIMEKKGYYCFSLSKKSLYWNNIHQLVYQRIQTPPDNLFFNDRIGYFLNWTSISSEIKQHFLPLDILNMLITYLEQPYLQSLQIHSTHDTDEGKKAQPWHRDITTSSHEQVSYFIMVHPEEIIGTFVKPGSHIKSDFHSKNINGQRVTFKDNAFLFDEYLYHYGPSSTGPIYKLLFTFVTKEVYNRLDYSGPEFEHKIINQSVHNLIKELYE